jgi:flagellar biosynthetic protein FliR
VDLDVQNWMLVFVRVGAFLSVLPFFSATNFPVRLRVALAALTALLLTPSLPAFPRHDLSLISTFGLLLGFTARMVFYAVDLAGGLIATEMGLNLGSVFNPLTGSQTQAPASIMFFLAAVVMLTLDLHHWMLVGFERTYSVLPVVGGAHLSGALLTVVVGQSANIFWVALQIAAPIIAVSFVITVVFAVLSRAVPTMNVFAESFAFRTMCGLAVFGLTMQLMAQHVLNYLRRLPDDLMSMAQLLGAG